MKKIITFTIVISLLILAVPAIVGAKSFNDLTSYQKQKYWVYMNDCSSLLQNKEYNKYRICALAVFEKASQEKETNAWCTDSDGGKNFLTKGIVKTDIYPQGKEDYIQTFPNGSTFLMEGFCSSKNQYAFAQKKCSDFGKKYYAKDGACVYENKPPVLTDISNKEINEGELLSFSVSANDPDNDNLFFSAEGLPVGAILDNKLFSWTPTFVQAGQYNVKFNVSDGESEDFETITITIKNVNQPPILGEIGNQEISAGQELSLEIVAYDSDNDALVYSAENLPEGAVLNVNTFSWTPNYEQAGKYEITFKVSDGNTEDLESVFIVVKPVTTVKGIISGNTVWTLGNSPYIVIGHVLVEEGASLTIEPGVVVKFDSSYYLRIDGTLVADGTEEQKIVFTSNKKNPAPGDWDKIKFTDTSTDWDGVKGSVVRNAKIEYGGSSIDWPYMGTIMGFSASPLIEKSKISDYSGHGIYTEGDSSPIIKNNVIENGISSGGYFAIMVRDLSQVIENTVINNKNIGIYGADRTIIKNNKVMNNGGGILCSPCAGTIEDNVIINNSDYGLLIYGKNVGPSESWTDWGSATVKNNVIKDNKGVGIMVGGDGGGSFKNVPIVINDNYISTSEKGIFIYSYHSDLTINSNNIVKNDYGFFIHPIGSAETTLSFSHNNIYDYNKYAVFVEKGSYYQPFNDKDIIATNNYFGTAENSVIQGKINDFYDNFDLPKVIYEPFATEPFEID